ncbi:MAG TPA: hypothetical protein VFQ88_03760 [Nevskiaceae bacterium]|nr:hypothetical protein [Nevskiaceae bacterium]
MTEAARIFCEDELVDYRAAKLKAAQRLGLPLREARWPDNASVRDAVLVHQRLYGGPGYAQRLMELRRGAVQAMRLLADFDPCLVGAVVSGAITYAHRVQLHAFADSVEQLDIFLHNQRIACEAADRDYRFPGGRSESVPISRFELNGVGVDVAVFDPSGRSRPPLAYADAGCERRLNLAQAQALLARPPASSAD